MEQYTTEHYLARIGYSSGPEQQIAKANQTPRLPTRLATIEKVQAEILNQLKAQTVAQQQHPPTISPRLATQTRTLDLREETLLSILPGTPSPASTPGTETSYQPLEPRYEPKSPSSLPPPPTPTKAEILAGLYVELKRRRKICLGIERQIEACQKEISSHPSKQKKIEKEHEKRLAESVKLWHNENQKKVDAEKRKDALKAEEAEFEEVRKIELQYDRDSIGAPTAESVDTLFVIIANTEHRLKKAEEARKAAKKREVQLEEKLYKARCAMFEMEDEIEEVENGASAKEAWEPRLEESRIGGQEEGKRKPRRGKGVRERQQGEGDGGDEKVGRRRRRRRNISGRAAKIGSDTALDS